MRKALVLATLVVLLAGFNWSVLHKERLRRNGVVALLELAPVDPRALLLGDYMALEYRLNRTLGDLLRAARPAEERERGRSGRRTLPEGGMAVLRLDENKVARSVRLDDGSPPAADEVRVFFRVRGGGVRLAAAAFFFQEGHAKAFERARYGELRVAPDGGTLLVHMRDEALQRIEPHRARVEKRP